MAKMRYSEMPRDISCDSLAALRIAEGLESKRVAADTASLASPTINGKTNRSTASSASHCYDNFGSVSTSIAVTPSKQISSGVGGSNSTHSLLNASSRATSSSTDGSHQSTAYAKSHSLPPHTSFSTPVVIDVLRVSAEDLSSQLTLLDLPAFKAIQPDELSSCAWNKRNKLSAAPNVVAFTRRFNHVSFWTVQEILNGATSKHRAELVAHFIRVAKRLYDLNNLHSLFAVVSALQSASVFRLSKTWSHLSKKERAAFERLADVFSDQNNWRNLRDHMDSVKLPCIPYLGLFLTDLTYIDMAHPFTGGLEPPQRRLKMNNILRIIADLQQSEYKQLAHLPHIQRHLRGVRYIDELQKFLEDDQYKLSLKLEPASASAAGSRESVGSTGADGSVSGSSSAVALAAGQCVASLNLSPAKGGALAGSLRLHSTGHHAGGKQGGFVPSHRKCRSLGTNIFSKWPSGPSSSNQSTPIDPCLSAGADGCPTVSNPRHLLDDSVLEESPIMSRSTPACILEGSKNGVDGPCSDAISCHPVVSLPPNIVSNDEEGQNLLALHGSPDSSCDEDSVTGGPTKCLIQGCLRRKTLIKDGRKPSVAAWQRYWVQLWSNQLVFFPAKSFKGSDRSDFKREKCKVFSVAGCIVRLGDNPIQPDVFTLTDPHRGNMYKYRAGSAKGAEVWLKHLHAAASKGLGICEKPLPANLIAFE